MSAGSPCVIVDLACADRERAVPVLADAFSGIYRWHAKRTLRRVSAVRAATQGDQLLGISMLEPLAPRVGYVYYIAVLREHRGTGIGAQLLDNALRWLRSSGSEVVYAAVRDDGVAARGLFESRRFRIVPRNEPDLEHGGLGADRFRHQMTLVPGEVLLGLRFASEAK